MNHKLAIAAICTLPCTVLAATPAHKYEASAELGALFKTGNTKSGDIKTGLDFKHEYGQFRSTLDFDLLVRKTEKTDDTGKDNFETTDQKWKLTAKTNYTIEPKGKNYIYGNADYTDDRFSGFDNQTSVSTGWGRRWFETEKATLDADIGPGYKRDVLDNGESSSTFIVQAQAQYLRKINEHVDFKQFLSAKIATESNENSKYEAESSITTKLIETLQLKFSFKIDHNTEVAADKKKTDTQTAVTLVYSF